MQMKISFIALFITFLLTANPQDVISISIDDELKAMFLKSFLDEKDFNSTMKLANFPKKELSTDSTSSNSILMGQSVFKGTEKSSLESFTEHHSVFRTANEARQYLAGLVKNNSMIKPPDKVIKNDVGEIYYMWCFEVGTISNEIMYSTKFFTQQQNLVIYIHADQKPFHNGASKENLLFKLIPPYARLAVNKYPGFFSYFQMKARQDTSTINTLQRGMKVRTLPGS